MTTFGLLITLAVFALLFAVFSLVRQRPSCGSDCGNCAAPCSFEEWKNERK
jgi:hypothetical protein